ncbi:MAG: glycerophosphodiester phosphodiesterase family protein [Candidatus Hydrogenedentes bacterium]|nr:glycerophosphodiester phosphodiesterase family protein [Candidatus Hydrogenedentota bacterium]
MRLEILATILFTLCAAGLAEIPKLPPLSDAEIIAITEHKSGKLSNPVITREPAPSVHVKVESVSGEGPVEATIDSSAARVQRLKTAGKDTYIWPGIILVGHRGTVKFAPENTIVAFNTAIEHGADLLEMDIRETKDGHLIVMHDASIARTTTGRGDVALMNLEEIRAFDAGSKFDAKFIGEKVPTFQEVLKAIEGRALPDIDFKAGDPQKLVEAVRAAGLVGKGTLYCGDWAKLKETLAIEPGFVIRPTAPKGLPGLNSVIAEFDPPIVNIDWGNFSEELVRRIHIEGKLAFVNTMGKNDNEASYKRAISAGADYIQSDNLELLLPILKARGLHM